MGMAGRVSPLVRGLCFALLALCSCRGTERVLFDEITPTVVDRPVELRISRVDTTDHDYHNPFGKGLPP